MSGMFHVEQLRTEKMVERLDHPLPTVKDGERLQVPLAPPSGHQETIRCPTPSSSDLAPTLAEATTLRSRHQRM